MIYNNNSNDKSMNDVEFISDNLIDNASNMEYYNEDNDINDILNLNNFENNSNINSKNKKNIFDVNND